jgi:sugar phosphate isomerase/epimerase
MAATDNSPKAPPAEFQFAINAWCLPRNSSLEDIAQSAAIGAGAIGLWEGKFKAGEEDAIEAALDAYKMRAGIVMPHHWTILPTPLDPGGMTYDWRSKSEAICRSIRRLARFKPIGIMVGPGVSGDPAKRLGPVADVAEGLKMIADVAGELGQRIAFEPLALRRGAAVATLPETIDLLDKVGRDNVYILPDLWHSWPEDDFHAHLRANVDRFIAVQVNDVRDPERSWCDRVLPGDGRNICTSVVATLIDAGFKGWYDFEVFSDDGTWGNDFPDSLWKLPHDEFLRRGHQAFLRCYANAKQMIASGRLPR